MVSLTEIAEGVLANAKRLDEYTASKGLRYSTFEKDTWCNLPDDLEDCRKSLVDSTQELKQLAHGPVGLLLETLFLVGLRSRSASILVMLVVRKTRADKPKSSTTS